MQRESDQASGWNILFLLTAALVVLADQFSKSWLRANLAVGEVFPDRGFFQFVHARNTGAVFGLFRGQTFPLTVFAFISIFVLVLFVYVFSDRFSFLDTRSGKVALGLIMGGTIGNLIDRLTLGYVTDFISIGIWPMFNVADASIVIGVLLVIYNLFSSTEPERH